MVEPCLGVQDLEGSGAIIEIREVEIAHIDLRYAHTRLQSTEMVSSLAASIENSSPITPVITVKEGDFSFVLIDGYLRVRALSRCGKDTVLAEIWPCKEWEALLRVLMRTQERKWQALEQALMLRELRERHHLSQAEIALNGQQAENEFVGCNCGIMDQLISAQGKEDHALLIDCRSLDTQAISTPKELSIMIINSNKKRGLVESEYNTRRQQCEEAAGVFGVQALRDVTIEQFNERIAELDETVAKRARHVITENDRTLKASKALSENNIRLMGQLMTESHASMRDDFEITVPEVDTLVDIVKTEIADQGGVRMTGGGFGGCIVALVPPTLVDQVKAAVESKYQAATGLKESIYVCQAKDGASFI